MLEKELWNYYQTNNLKLPQNSKWRYFKFRLLNSRWLTLKIRNEKQLKKYCLKYLPLEIYYSTSEFLNPLKAENPSYQIADRLFLRNKYLTFDLDNEDFNVACSDALKLIRELDYPLKEIHFTGGKGLRLLFDVPRITAETPKRREELTIEQREKIVDGLSHIESIDSQITIDMNRIIRFPGSVHRTTLFICKHIDVNQLHNPGSILTDAMIEREGNFSHQNAITEEERTGLISSSFKSYKFMDAMVSGCNGLYAPFLIFHKSRFRKKIIKNLQKVYNLSDFYIFDTEKYKVALCCKTVDKRRYLKIARFCKAKNLRILEHYDHQWIRTSSIINGGGGVIENKPHFKEIIGSEYGYTNHHSKPHLQYLQSIGIDIDYPNLCGTKNKIKISVMNNDNP